MSLPSQFLSQLYGNLTDLNESIAANQRAVDLSPIGESDPVKATCFSRLGDSFQLRFECLGKITDFNKVITCRQDTVNFTPNDHPDKVVCASMNSEYPSQQQVIDLAPGHPDMGTHLSRLGQSLYSRFKHTGFLLAPITWPVILTSWVSAFGVDSGVSGRSLTLKGPFLPYSKPLIFPITHNKAAYFNNLGNTFLNRFEHQGELADLDRTITALQDAVDLTSEGESDIGMYLDNLGNALHI
ncbi:hypothetical protein M422DRAFT_261640 [Sphaerobolus stellatus SS14]|uniref:Uncharacterized protein n=1 Tax=Sphaerobolus stellatus (strain SS14) TaxID=990650 RepID=A0A0C9U058_SPHS4|nr:hypothetical protein M422DRAFT_261640 [Sphaerobolus stellatus SS14]